MPGDEATDYDAFFGPFYFEPYARELVARMDEGQQGEVLELGAGTGRVTAQIRKRIPAGSRLVASDIDAGMLAFAEKKLAQLDIEWRIIDACELPFEANTFQTIVCGFGYMFVPDKEKAFSEAYRVLRPGGQLLFTTWDKLENNPASFIARTIAEQYLTHPVPASYDTATSMSDAAEIETRLQGAGFRKITIERLAVESGPTTAREAARVLSKSGIYPEVLEQNPDCVPDIESRVHAALAARFGESPMVAPASALISQAWK
ncbi:MAG: methyltransferase domain-containing protein [Chitinophagaceae bacterium]|nr:MAG: methyltransferase domain-containing protein [Chitinophagaceae bacterium]